MPLPTGVFHYFHHSHSCAQPIFLVGGEGWVLSVGEAGKCNGVSCWLLASAWFSFVVARCLYARFSCARCSVLFVWGVGTTSF